MKVQTEMIKFIKHTLRNGSCMWQVTNEGILSDYALYEALVFKSVRN